MHGQTLLQHGNNDLQYHTFGLWFSYSIHSGDSHKSLRRGKRRRGGGGVVVGGRGNEAGEMEEWAVRWMRVVLLRMAIDGSVSSAER